MHEYPCSHPAELSRSMMPPPSLIFTRQTCLLERGLLDFGNGIVGLNELETVYIGNEATG